MKWCLALLLLGNICAEEALLPGHSHLGESFNEGPRQEGSLLGRTGEVNFPVSTTWDKGQDYFNQGLGQLHGFWYYEAERSFRNLAAHDPDCAMAYWGMAEANWENEKRAKGFIKKAEELSAKATPREQLYIKATANFWDGEPKDEKQRSQQLLLDLEKIVHEYPEDIEAKAILALRIWQFSRKGLPITSREAVDALLQQVFAKAPNHPAHHYRVHLWDEGKPERALDSAAKLGPCAPAIAHMWHMPGHIYSKLHRYRDAAWHQEASARVDHHWMGQSYLMPDKIHNYAHNNEWLSRNWINLGKGEEALEMSKSLLGNPRHPKWNSLSGKAQSYVYGRDRLLEILERFEMWDEALRLSKTEWLAPTDDLLQQGKRLRLIALAQAELGDLASLVNSEEALAAVKKQAEEKHAETSAEARKKAEAEGKKDKELDQIVKNAVRPNDAIIAGLAKIKEEIAGYHAELSKDAELAKSALEKGARPDWAKAQVFLRLGFDEKALEFSKKAVDNGVGEVLPLAARVEVLAKLGPADDLRPTFEKLRVVAGEADLKMPALSRMASIAATLGIEGDWRLPAPPADDLGERPNLDSLGPVHWEPRQAVIFSFPDEEGEMRGLVDYEGKPVLVVFYLGFGCLHCAEQLNALATRVADFEKAGLPIFAVSTDSAADLRKSHDTYEAEGERFPFHLVADEKMSSFRDYGCYDDFEKVALHGTFLISAKGKVLWADVSAEPFMDMDFLLKEFPRLLKLHE